MGNHSKYKSFAINGLYRGLTPPREGRGVALFVENSIHFKPRIDLDEIELNSFESIFIEITNHKKQKLVIGTIY